MGFYIALLYSIILLNFNNPFLLKEFRKVRGVVIKQDERIESMWRDLSEARERVNEFDREKKCKNGKIVK